MMSKTQRTPNPLDCPHRFVNKGRCKHLELCIKECRVCNGRLWELGKIPELNCDGCSIGEPCAKGKARVSRQRGDETWKIPKQYGELCAPALHHAQEGTDYSEYDSKVLVINFRDVEHPQDEDEDWRIPEIRYALCDLKDYAPESVGITERDIFEIYKADTRRRGYRKPRKVAQREMLPFEKVPVLVIDSTIQYLIDTDLAQNEIAVELRVPAEQVYAVTARLRDELENGCYADSPRQAELLRILVVDRGKPPNNGKLAKKLGITERAVRDLKEKLKINAPWSYWGLPKA